MSFDHPIVLLFAVAICSVWIVKLWRFFFETYGQYEDDACLPTQKGRVFPYVALAFLASVGLFTGTSEFFFRFLGFALSVAGVIGAAYHALIFIGSGLL